MIPSRRAFLMGAAALSAAVATPEMTRAAAALNAVAEMKADWALATRDVAADAPRHALRLIHGRAPSGLEAVEHRAACGVGAVSRARDDAVDAGVQAVELGEDGRHLR